MVMTVAWFDLERSELSWAGVGNVDARLVRSGPELREDVALVFGGVIGYRMPHVRPATMALERGDVLVMITDGIDGAISPRSRAAARPRRWPSGSSRCMVVERTTRSP